jgi:CcmD family protein
METLLAVYAVAWAAVSAYVSWLAVANRRLARRLERLETLVDERQINETTNARVA